MELDKQKLDYIIQAFPGDFAVYQLKDKHLRVIYNSPDLSKLSGMTDEEYEKIIENDAGDIVIKSDRERVAVNVRTLLEDKEDIECIYRIMHKTKGFVWIHARVRLLGELESCPVFMIVFVNASLESEEHLELINNIKDIVYVVDRYSYELLYVNEPAMSGCVYSGENYCGKKCFQYVSGFKFPCPWCSLPRMVDGKIFVEEGYSSVHDKWFRINCSNIKWYGRDAVAIYSIDITEQKKQQLKLEESMSNLENIINNVPLGIAVCKLKNGRTVPTAVNNEIKNMMGVTKDNFTLSDHDVFMNVYKEDQERVLTEMMKMREPDAYVKCDFRYNLYEGKPPRWYALALRTVLQEDGCIMAIACVSDVTAEKNMEEESYHIRKMYESAVENAKLVVWKYDIVNHRITMMDNESTVIDMQKFSLPKVIENVPESILPLIDDNDIETFKELYRKLDEGEPSASCEVWYKNSPDREQRCERISYTTIYDENNNPVMAYGIGQNVTSRKYEQEKNKRTYKQLTKINPMTLGVFRLNITQNICGEGQSQFKEALKLQQSGTVDGFYRALSELIPDKEIKEKFRKTCTRDKFLEIYKSGQTQYKTEYPIIASDGEIHWCEGYIQMFQNTETGDIEAITNSADITNQRIEENIVHNIAEKNCDFICIIDSINQTVRFKNLNINYEEKFSQNEKKEYSKCIEYALNQYIQEEERKAYKEGTTIEKIKQMLDKDDIYTYVFNCIPITTKKFMRKQLQYSWLDSVERYILVVQTDITDIYEQEEARIRQMQEALNMATKANAAKTEFVSRISHDIRTPISVISSMTKFAFEDIDDKEQLYNHLQKIQSADTFLLSLINDILDISKIDSGNIDLIPEPYKYIDYINNIKNMFEPLCAKKKINFVIEEKENYEAEIMVDHIRLNQITLNLLSNAVKYTMEGGTITYSSKTRRRNDNMVDCQFEIRDTGIGMSEEFQNKMFEPFTQEYTAKKQWETLGGTGLGLSIVKKIVDMMDGSIEVNSKSGEGTVVIVKLVLPAIQLFSDSADEKKKEKSKKEISEIHGKVLLAEDYMINAEIATRIIGKTGLRVDRAENGRMALEMFEKSTKGEYSIILMDIQMPLMNGYEATRAIRKLSRDDAKNIPIVAMTADAFASAIEESRRAGMNDHITKPLDEEKLYKVLNSWI